MYRDKEKSQVKTGHFDVHRKKLQSRGHYSPLGKKSLNSSSTEEEKKKKGK